MTPPFIYNLIYNICRLLKLFVMHFAFLTTCLRRFGDGDMCRVATLEFNKISVNMA